MRKCAPSMASCAKLPLCVYRRGGKRQNGMKNQHDCFLHSACCFSPIKRTWVMTFCTWLISSESSCSASRSSSRAARSLASDGDMCIDFSPSSSSLIVRSTISLARPKSSTRLESSTRPKSSERLESSTRPKSSTRRLSVCKTESNWDKKSTPSNLGSVRVIDYFCAGFSAKMLDRRVTGLAWAG